MPALMSPNSDDTGHLQIPEPQFLGIRNLSPRLRTHVHVMHWHTLYRHSLIIGAPHQNYWVSQISAQIERP